MKLWHKLVRIDGGKAIYSDEKGWQFHVPCNEATMDIHHPTHVDMRVGEIPNGLPKTHVGWRKYAVGIPISNPQPV
jgi:hypothetical protein